MSSQLALGRIRASRGANFVFAFSPSDPSTIETNEEIEIAYPITCGESKAILLWKKFVCPGINVKCVKVGELSQQISSPLPASGALPPRGFLPRCVSSEPCPGAE